MHPSRVDSWISTGAPGRRRGRVRLGGLEQVLALFFPQLVDHQFELPPDVVGLVVPQQVHELVDEDVEALVHAGMDVGDVPEPAGGRHLRRRR